MSLYPQAASQGFGQAPYAAQSYTQPMIPPSYHYPPPMQPVYHVDPNMFRRDYMGRLAELNVNSRPIIQNLSMIAQEYSRFAEIVVQCIESHIRRVPPWMKLPAFYLLDAISKNVFDPYARHFTPIVVRLFLDTYEQVDATTRSKMEEMLLTWRTGAPTGTQLFGVVPQLAIERHIWGGDAAQGLASSSRQSQAPGSISPAQVLSELEFVLGQKERAIQSNPYDKTAQTQVAALQQLRSLVQAGVSQEELRQILERLRGLAQPTPAPPPHPIPPPMPSYTSQAPFVQPVAAPSYPPPPAYPPQPSYTSPTFNPVKSEPVNLNMLAPQPVSLPLVSQSASAIAPASTSIPVNNIASLYNALLKAGVVSSSSTGTPTGAGASAKAEETAQSSETTRDSAREYRKAILSHKLKLTSADITKHRSHIVELLYQRLPTQCKQCGIRFPDGSAGKKQMEDHLDMHFRQNRKAGQAVGRGYSRSWFVSVEDWVHDGAVDIKGKGRADGRIMNASAAAAAEATKRDAELRAQFVVVPSGDEAKSISCPICKEPLKSEFLEDDEEWVWRNAVKRDDKIYHATCHAEAMASKTSLAVRLRNELSSRSRSRTPEKQTVRTPPKLSVPLSGASRKSESPVPSTPVGAKRKAEDDDPSSHPEGNDLPPTKKQAISA